MAHGRHPPDHLVELAKQQLDFPVSTNVSQSRLVGVQLPSRWRLTEARVLSFRMLTPWTHTCQN